MKKYNVYFSFLLIILFLPLSADANIKHPLVETWMSGKYFNLKNKHVEYLEVFEKEEKKYNKIDYIFQLGQEASYHLDSQVLDFCYTELKRFFDDKEYGDLSTILYDALQINDIRFTKKSRLEIIESYNFVKPFSLTNEQRVIFFHNIIDLYLEDQNFREAERYLFLNAALTAKDPNFDIDLLLGHLSRSLLLNTIFGRTTNLKEIDASIWKLLGQNRNFIGKAANYTSLSHIANTYLSLDKKKELNKILLLIQDYRDNEIDVPLKSEIALLFTENLFNASKGITTNPKSVLKIINEKSNKPYNIKQLETFVISISKFTKIYTKVINNKKITKKDYEFSIKFNLLGENLDIYKKLIEISYYSQRGDKLNFEQKFSELQDVLLRMSLKSSSIFDFDKQKLSQHKHILEIALKNYVRIYGNEVRQNFIGKFFKIFNNDKTEIDFYSKVKKNKILKNKFLLNKANNFLKLNKEIDYLYGRLINLLTNNGIEQISRNFQHKKVKRDYRLYTDLVTVLKKQRSDFKNIENASKNEFSKSIFSNDLNLKNIQAKLNKKEGLYFYNTSKNYILRCFITYSSSKCFINKYKIDFKQNIKKFRNQILYSKKDDYFGSDYSYEFYELFFSGFDFNHLEEIIIKPEPKHLALPFNVLKSKSWKKDEYLGLKFSLSLLPTFSLESDINKDVQSMKYLGIGDPKYYSEKNAEEKFSQLFTLRSVENADELSKLSSLPETKFEILNSSKNFSEKEKSILLGNKATELNLRLLNLNEYKIIHFATHGLVSGDFSGLRLPSLALSYDKNSKYELTDGLLNSIEISEFSLNAKLIILSACQTVNDAGKVNSGFSGLASSFLNSGAEEVIATQWKIESKSASVFISNYVNELSEKNPKKFNKSLQKTINKEKYNHPFFWAPYIKIVSLKNDNTNVSENEKTEISSYYSNKDRIEYTNLKKFEDETWLTFYKIKFGSFFAKNYLARLKNNKIIHYETPFGSLKIIEIKKSKIILTGSIKNKQKQTIPVIIEFNKNTQKFTILERFDRAEFEVGVIENFFNESSKKRSVIVTYQNLSGEKQKNYFVDFNKNYQITDVREFTNKNNLAIKNKFFQSEKNVFKIEEIMPLSSELYDFKNGNWVCTENRFALYKILSDKNLSRLDEIKGQFLNYVSTKYHNLILFQRKCSDYGLFTYDLNTKEIKKLLSAPINFGEIFQIESEEDLYLAGHLSIQASVIGKFDKNITMKDNHLAWLSERDYIISVDNTYLQFVIKFNNDLKLEKIYKYPYRLLSGFTNGILQKNKLILTEIKNRDQGVISEIILK